MFNEMFLAFLLFTPVFVHLLIVVPAMFWIDYQNGREAMPQPRPRRSKHMLVTH